MRSPEEFERIRAANRGTIGLAGAEPQFVRGVPLGRSGLGDGILGAALGAAGPVRVASAFPPFSVTWDPLTLTQPTQQGSWLSEWLTAHVIRPEVDFAGIRYAPGDGQADYSGVAIVGSVVLGIGVIGTIAWVLLRAFGKGRRTNPRRPTRFTTTTRTRYYVSRRAA